MIGDFLQDLMLECGIERPGPQISATDYEMSQIRTLMTAAGQDINTRAEWSKAIKDTALSPGTATPLPADFQEFTETGAITVDGSFQPARVVLDPAVWQMLALRPSAEHYAHLSGGSLHISPAITSGTMKYISSNWLGTKSRVTANTDQPIFPDYLLKRGTIYRFKRQKGLPYDDLLAEFEADLDTAIRADRGGM